MYFLGGSGIRRLPTHLALRSPLVRAGVIIAGSTCLILLKAQSPVPLDILLTRGEHLIAPVTLLIAVLIFTGVPSFRVPAVLGVTLVVITVLGPRFLWGP